MANQEFIEGDEFDPDFLAEKEHLEKKGVDKTDDEARLMLRRRRTAYINLFREGEPTEADLEIVLNDLAWFCKEFTPAFNPRDGASATELMLIKEGRREVYQRIKDFAHLDEDVLLLKYHKPNH